MSSARVSMLVQAIVDQATGEFGGDDALKAKTPTIVVPDTSTTSTSSLVDNTKTDESWSIDDLFAADCVTAIEDKNSNSHSHSHSNSNVDVSQAQLSPENTLSPELYARIPHTMIFGTIYTQASI